MLKVIFILFELISLWYIKKKKKKKLWYIDWYMIGANQVCQSGIEHNIVSSRCSQNGCETDCNQFSSQCQ